MLHTFKNTRLVLLCALAFGFFSSTQTIDAATLHAIIVGDTYDESIGDDVAVDVDNVYSYIKKAASKSGLSSNVNTIYGSAATRDNFIKKLEQLEVEPDDVVIVGCHMHGYRFRDKESIWPNLYFGQSDNGLEFDYVINKLREKNPRLFIALADMCNTYVKKGRISTKREIGWIDWIFGITEKRNFKKLFLNYKGSIIAAGAIPGQSSWGNDKDGGYMTASFLDSIKDVIGKEEIEDVSWESVASQVEGRIEEFISSEIVQTPHIEMELQEIPSLEG